MLIPGPINAKIQRVIDTYQTTDSWLTGERIWPNDRDSAETIDLALAALLDRDDAAEAASILVDKFIEFDAFNALLNTLYRFRSDQTRDLCQRLVRARDYERVSFNVFQFYVNHFEPSNEEQIVLTAELSTGDLHEIYAEEFSMFVDEHLISEPAQYQAWGDLDILSSHTRLEEVYSHDIAFTTDSINSRIVYLAVVKVSVMLSYDGQETESAMIFPGKVHGYINAQGIFIKEFSANTAYFCE